MNQEFVGCWGQDSSRLEYLCMLRLRLINTGEFVGWQHSPKEVDTETPSRVSLISVVESWAHLWQVKYDNLVFDEETFFPWKIFFPQNAYFIFPLSYLTFRTWVMGIALTTNNCFIDVFSKTIVQEIFVILCAVLYISSDFDITLFEGGFIDSSLTGYKCHSKSCLANVCSDYNCPFQKNFIPIEQNLVPLPSEMSEMLGKLSKTLWRGGSLKFVAEGCETLTPTKTT